MLLLRKLEFSLRTVLLNMCAHTFLGKTAVAIIQTFMSMYEKQHIQLYLESFDNFRVFTEKLECQGEDGCQCYETGE